MWKIDKLKIGKWEHEKIEKRENLKIVKYAGIWDLLQKYAISGILQKIWEFINTLRGKPLVDYAGFP